MTDALPLSPHDLIAATCSRFSITCEMLRSPTRSKWLTQARRHVATTLLDQGMGLKDVGRLIGRDHTTVMYLVGRRPTKNQKKKSRRK